MAGGAPTRGIFLAAPEEIRAGKTSDIYFIRTLEVLKKARKDRTKVVLETTVQSLPNGWPWAVFAGLTEALNLLRGKPLDAWALPEGTIFMPKTPRGIPVPVLVVEGPYGDLCIYGTPRLGFL